MLIFGNAFIETPLFKKVESIEDISKTSPNDILYIPNFKAPFSLAKHCGTNSLEYAVKITSLKEALFANALGASYLVCEQELAKVVQNIADNYLWDLKVLAVISDDEELETTAKASIDGVIYQNYLKD